MWTYPITSNQVQFLAFICATLLAIFLSAQTKRLATIRQLYRRLSNRPYQAALCIAVISLAFNLLFTLLRYPLPRIHDEYSYLLAADTFANFRLSNPSHALWEHFESFHILAYPNLVSKYPPGNGLALALGQLLTGHPIVGVWLSLIAAQVATYWMLRAWTSPQWALFGGLAITLHAPILRSWGQSYWGGAVAMLGGALVFGALRRIWKRPRVLDSLALGLGIIILANSRPAEGFLICIPVFAALLYWVVRSEYVIRAKLVQVAVPAIVVGVAGIALMGTYNIATTGSATTMPYQMHDRTYSASNLVIWKALPKVPEYNHKEFSQFYVEGGRARQRELREPSAFFANLVRKIRLLWDFFPLGLGVGLLAIPILWRQRWMRFALVVLLFIFAIESQLATSWMFPHYLAPVGALFYAVNIEGLRRLYLLGRAKCLNGGISGRLNVGKILCRAILLSLCIKLGINALEWTRPLPEHPREQILAKAEIDAQSDHLVIVSYGDKHSPHKEYVYNEADIDNAHVVWARDMGPEKNARLLQYFNNRKIWRWHVTNDDTAAWDRVNPAL